MLSGTCYLSIAFSIGAYFMTLFSSRTASRTFLGGPMHSSLASLDSL